MGMRTVNDPYGDPSVLVDTVFGTSYDAVRDVANNIDYVKKVAHLFDTSDTIVSNLHQRYVSAKGQSEFVLPVSVVSEAFVTVFVNGKWKSPSVSYTAYDTTLYFNQALAQGDVVDVMIVSGETFDVLQKLNEDVEQNSAITNAQRILAEQAAVTATAAANTVTGIGANVRKLNTEATRAPLPTDDETQGYAVGSRWMWRGQEWVARLVGPGAADWVPLNDITLKTLDGALGPIGGVPPARTVRVDDAASFPEAPNRGNVVLHGSGRVDGWYRRQVASEITDGTFNPILIDDLDPARHLAQFTSATSPVVVVTGSSSATENTDVNSHDSSYIGRIYRGLAQAHPNKTVQVYGRGIGGQTFSRLNSIPTVFPSWYSDTARPWLSYIEELAPDTVFILMGSNDSAALRLAQVKAVRDKIRAWAKVPDIIWITQPNVSLATVDPHTPSYSTVAAQEGRDHAAGAIRSLARRYGDGLIDAARMANIVIDGQDFQDTALERAVTSQPLTDIYIHDELCHDFSMRVVFMGNVDGTFLEGASTGPVAFRVGSGQVSGAMSGDIVMIRKSAATGKMRFDCYYSHGEGGSVGYWNFPTPWDFPASPFALEITKRGTNVMVNVVGQDHDKHFTFPIIASGAAFAPTIGYYSSASGNPFVNMERLSLGRPRRYVPKLTAMEAFGQATTSTGMKLPWGGNGLNHLSELGLQHIVEPLTQPWRFRAGTVAASDTSSGKYTPTVTLSTNAAAAAAQITRWHRLGNMVFLSGAVDISPTTAAQCIVKISLPVASNLLAPLSASGVVAYQDGSGGVVYADNELETLQIIYTPKTTTANQRVRFTASYEVA